jgi:hypothetical protein
VQYFVGHFDGQTFTNDNPPQTVLPDGILRLRVIIDRCSIEVQLPALTAVLTST